MSKKLLTKKVPFQGKQLTMYSIDGITWSTRSEELQAILDRHSREQAGFGADLKGEEKEKTPQPKPKPKKFNRVHDDAEIDEAIDDDMEEDEEPEVYEDPDADKDLDLLDEEDRPKSKKGSDSKLKGIPKSLTPPKKLPEVKKVASKPLPVKKPVSKIPAKKVADKKPIKKVSKPLPKSKAKPTATPKKKK
jgi:hypothetical protein